MGFINRVFGGRKDQDPLGLFNLEDERLQHHGIVDGVRVWYTLDGDGIALFYFDLPPDLPREQPTIEAFCAQYRALAQGAFVETGIEKVASLSVVRAIARVPQTPTGNTYMGSYTIPFRDFSYVIKIQCEEHGITGVRESILLNERLASGEFEVDDSGTMTGNWAPEDAIHDDAFPDHPLSRCRRGLQIIASSMSLPEEIRLLPKFDLPSQ